MKETYLFEIVLAKGKFELEDGKIVETPFNIKGLKGYTLEEVSKIVSSHNQILRLEKFEETNE
jgi:hypothetical protein